MAQSIRSTPHYRRQLKRLQKKYRTALEQSAWLSEELKRGALPGDAIPGFAGIAFKVRRNNRAVPGGARKGYRFIYSVHPRHGATLLAVYAKTEQANISEGLLAALLRDAEREIPQN